MLFGQVAAGDYKMAKHLTYQITDTSLTVARDRAGITAEAALGGIYVIRTTACPPSSSTPRPPSRPTKQGASNEQD
jgi:hypothetical protein